MLRFYLEYTSSGKKEPTGNVITTDGTGGAYVAVYQHPNSAVMYGEVPFTYLSTFCKRITRAEARRIHPVLFERLRADGLTREDKE